MANVIIVGTQWGDEGKGEIVDLLAEHAQMVVRFQGGNLRAYLVVILLAMFALVAGFGGLFQGNSLASLSLPSLDFRGEVAILRVFALLVVVAAALATDADQPRCRHSSSPHPRSSWQRG